MVHRHNLFRGTRPQVFGTNPEKPFEGRIFVWAWTSWFERQEGSSGAVVFEPVASSEKELREWLMRQNETTLDEIPGDDGNTVIQEFLDQTPLFPESPELSNQPAFGDADPTGDQEHG